MNLDCAIPRLARVAVAVALAVATGVAASQTAARSETARAEPKADAKGEAKGDGKADAESAAAMERARRLADNPMRLILEASRSRARGVVVAPAVEATDAGSLRRTAVSGDASAPGAASPSAAAVTVPVPVASTPLPQLRSELAVAPAGPAVAAAPVPLSSTGLPAVTVAPVLPSLGSVPAPARLEASAAPQLLRMVEPEIPQRVLDQVGGQREVTVEFVVRADGTTGDINLLPPAPRALQRFVADALVQWRYAPLAEPRRMRVQLVFNGG